MKLKTIGTTFYNWAISSFKTFLFFSALMLALFLSVLAVAQVNTISIKLLIHSDHYSTTKSSIVFQLHLRHRKHVTMSPCPPWIIIHQPLPPKPVIVNASSSLLCNLYVIGHLSHSWPPWLLGVWLSSFSSSYSQFWSSGDQILSQVEVFSFFANSWTTFTAHVLEFCYWCFKYSFSSGLSRVLSLILLMNVV